MNGSPGISFLIKYNNWRDACLRLGLWDWEREGLTLSPYAGFPVKIISKPAVFHMG